MLSGLFCLRTYSLLGDTLMRPFSVLTLNCMAPMRMPPPYEKATLYRSPEGMILPYISLLSSNGVYSPWRVFDILPKKAYSAVKPP